MTRRTKPRNLPTPEPRLMVPSLPVDQSRLRHDASQAQADRMVADLLDSEQAAWVNATDFFDLPCHIQDLVSLVEHGGYYSLAVTEDKRRLSEAVRECDNVICSVRNYR